MIKRAFAQLLVCFTVAYGSFLIQGNIAQAQSNRLGWTSNKDMLLFYEAITKIKENALEPEPSRQVVEKAIRSYLRQKDRFSDYLSPKEYTSYRSAQNNLYCGLGMDIFGDRLGQIVCFPFPDGLAAKCGIEYGDLLIKINGRDVSGESVYSLGNKIRGKVGSKVILTVKKVSGNLRSYVLVRRQILFRSVLIQNAEPLPVIKILRFTNSTVRELKETVIKIGLNRTKIIDLRGNTGGDFFAAIDVASLFLKPGQKVIGVKTHSESKSYFSKNRPIDLNSKLFLWQDQYSASAAEVFLAALKQNGRAVTLGPKSFGKGLAQKIVELTDGSAIFITYGSLIAPNGFSFHDKGLEPTYRISSDIGKSDKDYIAVVLKLLTDQSY